MTTAAKRSKRKSRDVLDVARELLSSGDNDAVIELIEKLLASHAEQLRALVHDAGRRQRGRKNEGVSSAQLTMFLEELAKQEAEATAEADDKLRGAAPVTPKEKTTKAKKPPPRRRPIPPDLPRVRNDIPVPPAERACPVCGEERTCIGHETTSIIDVEPARVIVREDRREKLACQRCESQVVTAPLGDKVVEGGAYGSQLVAQLVVGKYADGLPLYRQREQLQRLGLDMPSSSMGDQIAWATDLLQPVWRALRDRVLDARNLHGDGTSLPVLDRDSPKGIKTGALWGWVGVDLVVEDGATREECSAFFNYTSTARKGGQREGELGPEDFLNLRRARGSPYVIVDAAGVFDASFLRPGLIEVGCNMHARRYFIKVLDAGDVRAALPIAAFKNLYDVEEVVAGKPPAAKLRARQRKSRPVYDELIAWCQTYKRSEPPSSALGKAVRYLLNHQVALTRYLDDGCLPIDNGVVERLHRKPAVGRRNYLFAGSDAGAERAAIAYSVLGTCKLLGVNPIEYLADVLPVLARGICIARDLPALMPSGWLAAKRS